MKGKNHFIWALEIYGTLHEITKPLLTLSITTSLCERILLNHFVHKYGLQNNPVVLAKG